MCFSTSHLIFAVLLASTAGSDVLPRKRLQRMRSIGNFNKMFGHNATGTAPPGVSTPLALPQQGKSRRLDDICPLETACNSAVEAYVSAARTVQQCGTGILYKAWYFDAGDDYKHFEGCLEDAQLDYTEDKFAEMDKELQDLKNDPTAFINSEASSLMYQLVKENRYAATHEVPENEGLCTPWDYHNYYYWYTFPETRDSDSPPCKLAEDKLKLVFLPQEYCSCSASVPAHEASLRECTYDQFETLVPGSAKAWSYEKSRAAALKKHEKQIFSEACKHICQTESAALDQVMESLSTECSSGAKIFMTNSFLTSRPAKVATSLHPLERQYEKQLVNDPDIPSLGDRIRLEYSGSLFSWQGPDHDWELEWNQNAESMGKAVAFGEARGYSEEDVKNSQKVACRDPFFWEEYYYFLLDDPVTKKELCSCPRIAQAEAAYMDLRECLAREVDYFAIPVNADDKKCNDRFGKSCSMARASSHFAANNIKGCKKNIPATWQDLCEGVEGSQQHVIPATTYGASKEDVEDSTVSTASTWSNIYVRLLLLVPALVLAPYH